MRRPLPVLPLIAVAGLGLLLAGCSSAPVEPEAKPITDVAQGDCFDTDAEFTTALVYPDCSAPHLYEAHLVETLEGDVFPGDEAVAQRANETCDAAFLAFTGLPVSQSTEYASMFLGPTDESWAMQNDRTIVCVIMPMSGQSTSGSAAIG